MPLFRYLRALAAFYIRLTFKSFDVYDILEPLMKDYRKLRTRDVGQSASTVTCAYTRLTLRLRCQIGGYHLTYFDEFIDQLLTEERVCEVILPRLTRRDILEETEGLAKRTSLLVSPRAWRPRPSNAACPLTPLYPRGTGGSSPLAPRFTLAFTCAQSPPIYLARPAIYGFISLSVQERLA
jgi:hypothetical protein